MRVGVQQLLIVLVIVIIIFGPTQIPKLTKMFGKSVKGFKEGMEEPEEEVEDAPKPKEKKKKRSRVGKFFRVLGAVISSGITSPSEDEQERAMDYSSREDENYIFERTKSNIKRQSIHLALYTLIGVAILGLVIWERAGGAQTVAANGAGTAFT